MDGGASRKPAVVKYHDKTTVERKRQNDKPETNEEINHSINK